MSLFHSLIGRFINNRYGTTYNRLFLGKQAEYVSVTGNEYQIYQSNSVVRSVVDKKASMFSNGIFKHYDRNGDIKEVSPVVDFLEKPNIMQTRNEFLMQMKVQECLYGNAFNYKLIGSRLQETPSALWNLPPQRVIVNRTGKIFKQTDIKEIIESFELILDDRGQEKIDPELILWRTTVNPDDPVSGMSVLKSLAKEITNIGLAMDYRNTIMARKGALGVLSSSNKDSEGGIPLNSKERERLEKAYPMQYGVGDKQSSVIITDASLNWTPMSYPTKDLMLFEEIDNNKRIIIDAYGLNENIFSRMQGSTYENMREGEKIAYQDTIIPEAEDYARGLSEFLGLTQKGEWLELCYDHLPILQEDEGKKAEVMTKKAAAISSLSAIYTPDEIKNILGLEI